MANTYYEIPLSPAAQRFYITLAGIRYLMLIKWCDADMGGWVLDISDASGNPLLTGLPLVTGVDLLEPYSDLNFGGSLYVYTDGNPDAVPTFKNLGTDSHLYFAVPQ